jgi:hypothetical protein
LDSLRSLALTTDDSLKESAASALSLLLLGQGGFPIQGSSSILNQLAPISPGNWKMDATENASGDIEYSYKIVKGISKIQGAIKVLRDMDYPKEIIDTIVSYDTHSFHK